MTHTPDRPSENPATALSDGLSKWITGEAAREDVQILRAESCAVVTGVGTVLADNPQLNVRAFPTVRQPVRVIADSSTFRCPTHPPKGPA